MARNFNGSTDDINCGDSTVLDGASTCTVVIWLNEDVLETSKQILDKMDGASNRSFQFFKASTSGDIGLDIWDTTNRLLVISTDGNVIAGTYTHLAWVWNGINSSNIYQDGTSLSLNTQTANSPSTITNSSNNMAIAERDGDIANLDGTLAFLAMWDTNLTSNEIAIIARGINPWVVQNASLVSFYPIEGNDSTEPQFVGQTFTGTVSGSTKVANPPVELLETYL